VTQLAIRPQFSRFFIPFSSIQLLYRNPSMNMIC